MQSFFVKADIHKILLMI